VSAAAITARRLAEWRQRGHPYLLIAALITEWAKEQERGTAVPENDRFAEQLPIVCGSGPYKRAKRFLATQGVLWSNDGPYMVA
jgi:hypothetical protein